MVETLCVNKTLCSLTSDTIIRWGIHEWFWHLPASPTFTISCWWKYSIIDGNPAAQECVVILITLRASISNMPKFNSSECPFLTGTTFVARTRSQLECRSHGRSHHEGKRAVDIARLDSQTSTVVSDFQTRTLAFIGCNNTVSDSSLRTRISNQFPFLNPVSTDYRGNRESHRLGFSVVVYFFLNLAQHFSTNFETFS